ncbi:MAG: tetratricopeptide repeat protein [Acidobacteriaceae bacterium]|nr:tetratricopeptide repeat protein [Acidobacteriaceae bacterium]
MWQFRALIWWSVAIVSVAPARAADGVTFNKDIAPIVFERCASCHRPGQIGPFSLLTYRDARQHLTQIVDATKTRVMPPWKPVHGSAQFVGDRSLSDAEIALIQRWAAEGAVEGEPGDLPSVPHWNDGWQLGVPDVVAKMSEVYTLRADGGDVFRTFVLPIPTDRVRYVRAIEFNPGNTRAVHHANIGVDHTSSSRRLDAADPEVGYSGGMVPDASYPPGYMLGWTPGQRPRSSPPDMAWRLEPGSDLVVQLHMQPTGKPEPVQVSAAFYFTDTPPSRSPVGIRLGSETIDIPAGASEYVITDEYVVPVDAELLAVQPHAHNLGRTMFAEATRPDGSTATIIDIRDWDFRWQDVYLYQTPIALPRGTRLSMRFTYDNSATNARNPVTPPQRVVWGQNTTDEMGDLWLQVVPKSPRDLAALNADVNRKSRREDIAAYTKILRSDPQNPLRHDTVAMLHLEDGRPAVAAAEFRESLTLNPDSAPTHYNLGLALSLLQQYNEALAEFQAAVRIDPNYGEAQNNLGAMLYLFGRFDEASVAYRRAIAIKPDNVEARANLGRLLVQTHQNKEAMAMFEQALLVDPNSVVSLIGLAWVKAVAPERELRDAARAIELAQRARTLAGTKEPSIADTLAAAYAAAGNFDRAVSTAEEAVASAEALKMQSLAADIRARLDLYQHRQAYVSR